MFFSKRFLWIVIFGAIGGLNALDSTVDVLVFSYNRPLQLYALLESIDKQVTGVNQIFVLYRADTEYAKAYITLEQQFDNVVYVKQGEYPAKDFKKITQKIVTEISKSRYIVFAVDDIIVKNTVDLISCAQLVEQTGAYGFYLRLGKNLTQCYMRRCAQPLPAFKTVAPGVYSWIFKLGLYDWNYPNTVDMTLYRKKDVIAAFERIHFTSPNTLEAAWNQYAYQAQNRIGLCFELSAIVNLPLNLVQKDFTSNRNMGAYTTEHLLDIFNQGLKIDINPLQKIVNRAAHMEYEPTFISK